MRFAGWFFTVVGFMIIAQWIFFLATGSVPELQTEPIAIGFHLAAEFLTALSLLVAGIGLLRKAANARNFGFFAAGMLAYTVIVSPGYFAQLGQWPLVGMFAVLLILDVFSVMILFKKI